MKLSRNTKCIITQGTPYVHVPGTCKVEWVAGLIGWTTVQNINTTEMPAVKSARGVIRFKPGGVNHTAPLSTQRMFSVWHAT
ncbi:unnamed protein product, partial [Ectocarpus fasciculatus]